MPRNRQLSSAVSLVRPMLAIRRAKVVEYLSQIGQSYRDDESNQDVRFARNRLRHELLPLVRAGYSSDIDNSLLRLGNLAYDAQQVIGQLVESRVADAVSLEKRIAVIECGRLRGDSAYVVREVLIEVWRTMEWPLQSMGFEQWQSLSAIMDTDSDAHLSLPGNVRAQKKDGQLELSRPSID
jgi:tRNA(Ile)-lysidine synthase